MEGIDDDEDNDSIDKVDCDTSCGSSTDTITDDSSSDNKA